MQLLGVVDIDGFPCLPFANEDAAADHLAQIVRKRIGGVGVSVNALKLHHFWNDPEFRRICQNAILPTADGSTAILGIRWLHGLSVARINMPAVALKTSARHGFRVALVGASEVINSTAAAAACRQHPGLRLVFRMNGYASEDEIAAGLRSSRPEVVLLGMGSPRQEFLAARLTASVGHCVIIGCGGALDVLAGATPRAPKLVTRFHAEWLYRTLRQPQRIGRLSHVIQAAFRTTMVALRR